jgi:S-adenosyl methyltransferase
VPAHAPYGSNHGRAWSCLQQLVYEGTTDATLAAWPVLWLADGANHGGVMAQADEWVPAGIDIERPSPARMYDYLLGGAHNFAVDRKAAEQAIAVDPEATQAAWVNRAFLRRAVEFLVDAGVRQYLDIGSGIPTVGHVHEIAQRGAPESRVVFVDIDPVAVAHSRLIQPAADRSVVRRLRTRRAGAGVDAVVAARVVRRPLRGPARGDGVLRGRGPQTLTARRTGGLANWRV